MKSMQFWARLSATAVLVTTATAGMAQHSANDAQARFEQERKNCMSHNTQDSKATCLREAHNARDAARRGQLTSPGQAAADNATQRCNAFKTSADREECVRRVQGPATGSVSGGGLLRESVTTIEVPANQRP